MYYIFCPREAPSNPTKLSPPLLYIKQSPQTQNNQSPAPAVDSFDYSAQPHAGQRQSRRHARGTTSLRLLLPLPPSICKQTINPSPHPTQPTPISTPSIPKWAKLGGTFRIRSPPRSVWIGVGALRPNRRTLLQDGIRKNSDRQLMPI